MTLAVILILGSWVSWVDGQEMIVPDHAVILGLSLALVAALAGWIDATASLSGMLMAGFQFLLVYSLLPGRLGLGDVKYAILLGALLGPIGWLVCAVLGVLTALVSVIPLLFNSRYSRGNRIPLVPFLTIGGWGAVIGGFAL